MKNFFKKYSFVITLLLIITLMGVTFWFGIVAMYQKAVSLRDDIQKEIAHKENRERQIKRLPEIKSQYETVLSEEGHFNILLTEDRMVGLIQTMESLAEKTGTEVAIQSNSAKFEDQTKKKTATKSEDASDDAEAKKDNSQDDTKKTLASSLPYPNYLRLTLTVKGDYTEIVNFLHSLETLPVALDVLGVEVKQPIRTDDLGQGDVRSVTPFQSSGDLVAPTDQGQTNGDQANKDGEKVPSEIAKPISPQLEAVFDTVIYIAKK